MSPHLRIATVSVASATAIGLCGATGIAPPASAEPCTGPAAAAQPQAPAAPAAPLPTTGGPPVGHRPTYANARAALPRIGQIPRALLNVLTPQGQVQKQAGVAPPPAPPAPPVQQPTDAQPIPEAAPAAAPAPPPADPPGTALVGWVTGPNSPNKTLERFAVSGTDLGIMWDNGSRQILMAFGDKQYLNYMSIKSWDANGAWTTNYSAIAVSPDNGDRWGIYPGSVRTPRENAIPSARHAAGNENFQQGAFLKPGPGDPYIYSFGTPAGRGGPAFVARVTPEAIPDVTKYEYWNADQNAWIPGNPGAATPVVPGPVGEMSAQFNTYLRQYLMMYCNGGN